LAAIALGLFFYTAHRAAGVVVGLDVFRVDRIVVTGNQRLSSGEVMALLEGLRGQSILSVDLDDWRAVAMTSPWVADASLRKTLPSTVDVVVQERAPLGIGRINGSLYLVDDRGAAIDDYGHDLCGSRSPDYRRLSAAPATRATTSTRGPGATGCSSLSATAAGGQISQIDVSDRNAVVLLRAIRPCCGSNERFLGWLQSYFELAPALRESVPPSTTSTCDSTSAYTSSCARSGCTRRNTASG
jgi:hypothetical protein